MISQAAAARTIERKQNVTRAVLWMIGALISFSLMAIAGREATKALPTIEVMLWRSVFGALVLYIVVRANGMTLRDMRSERMGLHVGRSIVHFGAQFAWLYALLLIPLAELFALEFTAPLWVAVLAPLFLGERLTAGRIIAALLGFAGALVVVRPSGAGLSLGSVLALASAVGFAMGMIATKALTRTDGTLKILFWMNVLQTLIGAAANYKGVHMPAGATWGWLAVVCVVGLTAHFALAQAFKYADAIIVAPMDFMRLPLIAFIGAFYYSEPLQPLVLLGGAFVLAGNAINIWAEKRKA